MGARLREVISRRAFFVRGALAAALGFGSTVRAQVSRLLRYRPLSQPVVVPLDAMSAPWRVRPFTAEAVTLPSAATPNQPIRVSGMIVRTSAGERPEQFSAVCVRCPHELCDVDYVDDPEAAAAGDRQRDRTPRERAGLRVPVPQQHVQGRRRQIGGPGAEAACIAFASPASARRRWRLPKWKKTS